MGIIADIEKAFHQILVHKDDRDMLRFLWLEDVWDEHSVVHYRFCQLVFGLTPSPAILNMVIHHHLAECGSQEPQITELLATSLYVDDFVGGANDVEEAFEVYQKSKMIMREGRFNLRKWNTNSNLLRKRIDDTPKCEDSKSPFTQAVKILGLQWDTTKDELHIDVSELIEYLHTMTPTKRSLLKFSSKLFDPLGFVSPFVIRLKMLFQSLCSSKLEWDGQLEGEALKQWNRLPNDIKSLSKIRVQRCLFNKDYQVVSKQLHGFCDASEKAFAAVVYIHIEYEHIFRYSIYQIFN